MNKISEEFIKEWEEYNMANIISWEIDNNDCGIKTLTYHFESGLKVIFEYLK